MSDIENGIPVYGLMFFLCGIEMIFLYLFLCVFHVVSKLIFSLSVFMCFPCGIENGFSLSSLMCFPCGIENGIVP